MSRVTNEDIEQGAKEYADLLMLDKSTRQGELKYESTCLDFVAGAKWVLDQLKKPLSKQMEFIVYNEHQERDIVKFLMSKGYSLPEIYVDVDDYVGSTNGYPLKLYIKHEQIAANYLIEE